jgi:integrase
LGLKWKDIDFENKKLTVDRMRYRFGTSAPKTKNSRRTIVIRDLLINQLKLYRKWWLEIKLSKGKSVSEDDYILITSTATLVDDKYFNNAFDTIIKGTDFKRITSHSRNHIANE